MLIEQVIEFELRGPGPLGHRRSQGVRGSRPNWNVIYDKDVAKKLIVSSVLVSFSIFRVQRFLLAFVSNIDDQGPRAPLNSIFANQFNCITREKMRVFFLKFAISGPHLTFLWT